MSHGSLSERSALVRRTAVRIVHTALADVRTDKAQARELRNQSSKHTDGFKPRERRPQAEVMAKPEAEMFQYAQQLGAEKRRNPQDDIWTLLNTVEVEAEDGGRTKLGKLELNLFFMILILAGSETTRNAIASGLLALLDDPEQLATLHADRGAMPGAVDEILRWSSPVAYFARRANRDTEIRGVQIAKGDRVTMWYPSAHR